MILSFPTPIIEYGFINDTRIIRPRNRKEYLDICKCFLYDGDYEDILCSIMDVEYYEKAELQLKRVVDCYFTFKD